MDWDRDLLPQKARYWAWRVSVNGHAWWKAKKLELTEHYGQDYMDDLVPEMEKQRKRLHEHE